MVGSVCGVHARCRKWGRILLDGPRAIDAGLRYGRPSADTWKPSCFSWRIGLSDSDPDTKGVYVVDWSSPQALCGGRSSLYKEG
jgi:hypothetical protein